MPSATIIHAACFAVGAVVGGGLAAAVTRKNTPPASRYTPVVDASPSGQLSISQRDAVLLPPPLKYGNPGPVSDLLTRKAYIAGYDRRLRVPAWTAEHISAESLLPAVPGQGGDRQKSQFVEDESLPAMFRAKLSDYFRSGYDRGHMVPAADAKASQDAMNETFLLSNMSPQVGAGFNRHYWAYLENWCRDLTKSFSDVYIFTVPLFLPRAEADGKWRVSYEVIGSPPNVAVPTHFAKVVLASRPVSSSNPDVHDVAVGAFVLPNAIIPDEVPLQSFQVDVNAVERAAGLTLFSDAIKTGSKDICKTTSCQLIVRRFDEMNKKTKAIAAPR